MNPIILIVPPNIPEVASSTEYVIGAILAAFVLGYLLYSVVKHNKS